VRIHTRGLLAWTGLVVALFHGAFHTPVEAQTAPSGTVTVPVYFFWGEGCPHCTAQKPVLDELAGLIPQVEIRAFEVWYEPLNRPAFAAMAARHGFEPGSVPATFIGDRYWIGFHPSMRQEIEDAVIACIRDGCVDPGIGIVTTAPEPRVQTPTSPPPVEPTPPRTLEPPEPGVAAPLPVAPVPAAVPGASEGATVHVPLIGAVSLGAHPLALSTALIAFVDGFNPCSLWVLSILLALVLHTGSRRQVALVGSTFLLVTAAVYALFIVGLFRIFTVIDLLGPIQVVVALLAMGFALVNIKDYFWFGRGISFTISDRHKPKIYRDIRALLTSGRSTAALLGATVVMALGIALIELPCTAGFPVLWSNLVAGHGVSGGEFSLLLALYMTIYLLDELVVFGVAVLTLRMSRMEEKHGRVLKLVGGMVMLALALVLLLDPARMNNFGSSITVFGLALAATLLVLLVHRWLLPALGLARGGRKGERTTV
jgi:cytochrome c biogenesis protein CcdA/thiol-disulfide isomerase/thioredoxin